MGEKPDKEKNTEQIDGAVVIRNENPEAFIIVGQIGVVKMK